MNDPHRPTFRRWFWAGVVLTGLKLWLVRSQTVYAIGSADHDDRGFLQLAEFLTRGEWLGPAHAIELAKGPFYSCWIAFVYWTGLPLFFAQQLLYVAACAIFIRACRPAIQSGAALFGVYALLLWNPMTYDASSMSRVLPVQIYVPLTLLIFAGLVALSLRRNESLRRVAPWAAMLGCALGGFWLAGEHSFWIVVAVVLLAGTALAFGGDSPRETSHRIIPPLAFVALGLVVPILVVSGMNYRNYDWFGRLPARRPAGEERALTREEPTATVAKSWLASADFVTGFQKFTAYAPPSIGGASELELFRKMTRGTLSPGPGTLAMPAPTDRDWGNIKALQRIGKLLRPVLFALFVVTQILVLVRAVELLRRRRASFPFAIAAVAWSACVAYLFIDAQAPVTSEPVLAIASFAPIYPLLLIFIAMVFWDVTAAWIVPRLPVRPPKPARSWRAPSVASVRAGAASAGWWLREFAVALPALGRRILAGLLWFNSSSPRAIRIWFLAGLLLTAFKLWLTRSQPVYAIASAAHDDRLFLLLAESIVKGDWLGTYSQMTLAKGPFYSIWIALLYWAAIPLGLGVQLAYAGACALFTRACRPAFRSGAALFGIYALLLCNPMSVEAPTMGRIIRQQIYTPLGLAIFAGLVALYCRRAEGLRRQWAWATLLGLAFGCFWLTREESVWLVPSVALLAGAALYWAFRLSREQGRTMVKSLVLSGLCAALPLFLVSWENYRHYGWFGTVEFRAPEFKDAYGAMMRVNIGPPLAHVSVTRQAREAMYAVSPTFAQLRPHLEGIYGVGWAGASAAMTQLPAEEKQIGNGWLMWALRDSVAAAGYCHNAREALDFYRRMADEINLACDQGRLPAGPRRSGFLPKWEEGQAAAIARTVAQFADFTVRFKAFGAYPPFSSGDRDELLLFFDLTRDAVSSSFQSPTMPLVNQDGLNRQKYVMLQNLGDRVIPVLTVLFLTAQLIGLVRLVQAIRARQFTFPQVLAAAAWGGAFAYLLLNAMVHVTSFPVTAVSTFSPMYPLLLIFVIAVAWDAAAAWWGRPADPSARTTAKNRLEVS